MTNVRYIQNLPPNLAAFVTEIGAALGSMYGAGAATAYLKTAEASYSQLIRHPDVRFWACDSSETPGLLICLTRRNIGYLTLLHVLDGENGDGMEEALVEAATADLRDQGVRAIIGEFLRYRPLEIEPAMVCLGYSRFDRRMMIADLDDPRLALGPQAMTSPCGDRDALAASVLVDAYQGHPSRPLHPETHDEVSAAAFLELFRAGGFGATAPSLYRAYPLGDACQGMITGVETAPDVGFILHVASMRSTRSQGIGTHLVREEAEAFRDLGYGRIALGVTCGNPAERLYERLGFEHLMPVDTYVWWAAPN